MVDCLIKSCFNSTDPEMKQHLDYLLSEHDRYKKDKIDIFPKPKKPIPLAPTHYEIDYLEYMQSSFTNAGQFPSENLFNLQFPNATIKDIKINFSLVQTIPVEDFRVHIANLIRQKLNEISGGFLYTMVGHVSKNGIDDTVQEYVLEIKRRTDRGKDVNVVLRQNARDNYNERLQSPLGMSTGIAKLDNLIGGMDKGTVSVIAGFTSHMKTLFAMNIAYQNSYNHGYNIAYFSLETPKDMMYDQLLCRHSYELKFPTYEFIPHDRVRKTELSQGEADYLFDVVEADLHAPYHAIDQQGKPVYDENDNPVMNDRGLITFFDLSDFDTFSFDEITNMLEALDDKLNGELDAIIVDYVQLCKYFEGGSHLGDDNRIINAYAAYFRKLSQGFRSGKNKKKMIVVLLSQINRTSWAKAAKRNKNDGSEGHYDLTCLADANELERGAARVITTYTSENMKIVKEAQVQLLKNRYGATMTDPEKVFAKPEAYVYGEESGNLGQGFSGYMPQNSLMGALTVLDDDNITISQADLWNRV